MSIQDTETDQKTSTAVDVAFITALPIERDALLHHLEDWETVQDDLEPLTYYRGHISIPERDERYEVVLVLLLGMGNEEAAISTVKVIKRWQPTAILLVGIAGGVPGKVALGDVVVADFIYYYEPAKQMQKTNQRRALHFPTDRLLYGRAMTCEASEWRNNIVLSRPDTSQEDFLFPKAHFGAIGSGEKVIADPKALSRLLDDCPKLVAVAMEGAGVARAAAQQPHPPAFLEIRGICDYADEQKNDRWQPSAAEAASAFAIGLLRARPMPPLRERKPFQPTAEQRSLLVLCAQSLRPIAPDEILDALHQKPDPSPTIENITLNFTDLVVHENITDPKQAVQRLIDPQGALYQALRRRGEIAMAFHGLVHIPLAFLAGYLVTDRLPVRLFDFHPDLQTWIWPNRWETWPPLEIRDAAESRGRRRGNAVIRISASYVVTPEQTRGVIPRPSFELDLTVPHPERSIVSSEEQVRTYGSIFRQVLDRLAQQSPAFENIHIFYAGPVALAFHFGQQISANIHPAITVWNFHRGYNWGINLAAAMLGQPCIVSSRIAHKGASI